MLGLVKGTVLGAVGYYIVDTVIAQLITGKQFAPFGSDPNCKASELGGNLNAILGAWQYRTKQRDLFSWACVTTRGWQSLRRLWYSLSFCRKQKINTPDNCGRQHNYESGGRGKLPCPTQ